MVAINYRELKRQREADGGKSVVGFIREGLEEKWFQPDDFSLRRLAESTIEGGADYVSDYCRPGGTMSLTEASAVDTATFSNITGQIAYTRILQAYNDAAFLWPSLVQTVKTEFSGEKIPGIGRISDEAQYVSEGAEYPLMGVTQEYIETPETIKRGFIVPVTKEAVFFDRTNLVLQRCSEVGHWAGVNKEKECVKVACGVTNNFKRNGTAYDTYKTSGGHGIVNAHTEALVDWTDVEVSELKFDGMTDWNTGEPIILGPTRQLLVPSALRMTALRIVDATGLVHSGATNATHYQTAGTNPIGGMGIQVVSNPIVYAVTSQTNDWWYGDFRKAFAYMENWGITTDTAPGNSEAAFHRDIVAQYKVSWRGVAAVLDPHYVIQSTGGS